MLKMKPKKLSTFLGGYLLVSISLLIFGVMSWTWRTATQAVDRELKESFEHRHVIGQNILEREMERIESALHEVQLNKTLLSKLSIFHRTSALEAFEEYEEMDARNRLDILFISKTRDPVWLDASSPIPDSSSILPDIAVRSRELLSFGKILRFTSDEVDLTVMLKSMRLILEDGEILGVIVGGVVLNDNFPLLDEIRRKTKTLAVLMMEGDSVIASAGFREMAPLAEIDERRRLAEVLKHDEKHPIHLGGVLTSHQTVHLPGSPTTMKVVMAIDDAMLDKLKQTYRYTGLFLAASFIGFLLLTIFIIRQLTFPSLNRLLKYTAAISEGELQKTFTPGSVIELNRLGAALEFMASSIHEAQTSLRESIDRFSTVMDSLDFPIHVSDMDTQEVLFINKSARELWGDIVGKPCWETIQAGQTGPCDFCVNNELLDEVGAPTRARVWEHQNTGNQKWYEGRAQAIRWMDGRLARLETVTDVTERKQTQEIMIQTEKMMSIGGLAAGMAHEIKNPLGGILQNTQVLRNRILGDLPKNERVANECGVSMEVIKRYLEKRGVGMMVETIMDSGKRASEIIDNMLSFSRKSESKFAPHSLADLLDQTVEIAKTDYDLKKKYDFRRIEIRREYEEQLPPSRCEGSKIQQVYLNILKNGAEAMAEAGVKNSRFILRSRLDGDAVRIEIEDNGPGIDKETRERIFEPFFTTKGVGVGTGLGLSVSYFIITKNHGGEMSVESTPGEGAKFIIRIPTNLGE